MCSIGLRRRYLPCAFKATKDIRRLYAHQLRSVNCLTADNIFGPATGGSGIDQRSDYDRRIDDDAHRRSASRLPRICFEASLVWVVRLRLCTTSSQASAVGRAASRSSSIRRYSCMDLPCAAARAASSCRTLSGMSRMVICTAMLSLCKRRMRYASASPPRLGITVDDVGLSLRQTSATAPRPAVVLAAAARRLWPRSRRHWGPRGPSGEEELLSGGQIHPVRRAEQPGAAERRRQQRGVECPRAPDLGAGGAAA